MSRLEYIKMTDIICHCTSLDLIKKLVKQHLFFIIIFLNVGKPEKKEDDRRPPEEYDQPWDNKMKGKSTPKTGINKITLIYFPFCAQCYQSKDAMNL